MLGMYISCCLCQFHLHLQLVATQTQIPVEYGLKISDHNTIRIKLSKQNFMKNHNKSFSCGIQCSSSFYCILIIIIILNGTFWNISILKIVVQPKVH